MCLAAMRNAGCVILPECRQAASIFDCLSWKSFQKHSTRIACRQKQAASLEEQLVHKVRDGERQTAEVRATQTVAAG